MHTQENQLAPELLLTLSDTLHKQYRYSEHVHEEVSCQKYFWQNDCLSNYATLYCLCILNSSFLYWPLLCGGYLISIAYCFFFSLSIFYPWLINVYFQTFHRFPNLCVQHITRKKAADVLAARIMDAMTLDRKIHSGDFNNIPELTG